MPKKHAPQVAVASLEDQLAAAAAEGCPVPMVSAVVAPVPAAPVGHTLLVAVVAVPELGHSMPHEHMGEGVACAKRAGLAAVVAGAHLHGPPQRLPLGVRPLSSRLHSWRGVPPTRRAHSGVARAAG